MSLVEKSGTALPACPLVKFKAGTRKAGVFFMDNFNDFLTWEKASKDTIDFKKVYVDVSGDLIAGLLLSQIIYWHLPSKDGKSKLRVHKKDKTWLAKQRSDWWDEIRITPKQYDRAIGKVLLVNVEELEIT